MTTVAVTPEHWIVGYDEQRNTLRLAINDTHVILIDHDNVDSVLEHLDTREGKVHAYTLQKPEYKTFERDPDDEEGYSHDFRQVNDPTTVEDVRTVVTGEEDISMVFPDPRDLSMFSFFLYEPGYLDFISYKDVQVG